MALKMTVIGAHIFVFIIECGIEIGFGFKLNAIGLLLGLHHGFDGPALLKAAAVPTGKVRRWAVELAPLTRMEAWKVAPIKTGDNVAVLGFTFSGEKGEAVLRAEYLFVAGKAYGLRSAPV